MAILVLPLTLDASVEKLPDIGAVNAKRLAKLGIETIRDLLLTLPFGWETYGGPTDIASVPANAQATIVGPVRSIGVRTTKYKKVRLTEATVHDDSGHAMRIAWFNNPYVTRNLHRGDRVAFAGALKRGWGGVHEMQNPHYAKLGDGEDAQPSRVGGLMPKYHLVDGLRSTRVARWIESALPLADQLEDVIPTEVRERQTLVAVADAVRMGPKPESHDDYE